MVRRFIIMVALMFLATGRVYPCSWARGYFYQVTRLRGDVVGAKLGPLQYSRWLRQSFTRKNVKLTLYEYRWPINSRAEMPLVRSVTTDKKGNFDFGDLKQGHYTLIVDDQGWSASEWFDIEVTKLRRETTSVTVDVSPNFPDCKGGHELVIRAK